MPEQCIYIDKFNKHTETELNKKQVVEKKESKENRLNVIYIY